MVEMKLFVLLSVFDASVQNLTKFYFKNFVYYYNSEELSWANAARECRDLDGELVTVNSEEENNRLGNFICETTGNCQKWKNGVWIGKF